MFHIGGEQELVSCGYHREITNSGRSSLRLIIESAQLANKRILLPNFLCDVILDVFAEYDIQADFYTVDTRFNYQLPANIDDYDALYLIKYFGGTTDSFYNAIAGFNQRIIIIDDVFSPYPETIVRSAPWYSYNSLRKISPVADFSILYANAPLLAFNKVVLDAFARLKYAAKKLKSEYLQTQAGDEQAYLTLFAQAETLLDQQKGIFSPSAQSVLESIQFFAHLEQERAVRADHYELVKSLLPDHVLNIVSSFYSFIPLRLENRDDVRCSLMKKNIFLAIHWPEISKIDNALSESILSIPIDSRYNRTELSQLCAYINDITT